MTCPHEMIQFCPLYVAAHEAGGLGCDDGRLGEHDGCAVTRKLNYGAALKRLVEVKPELVEECALAEYAEQARRQRERNTRLNGIH